MKNDNFENRKYLVVVFITALIIPVLFYARYFASNQAMSGADLVQYFASKKVWMSELLSGEIPMWDKYLGIGLPQIFVTDCYIVSTIFSIFPLKIYMFSFLAVHLIVGGIFFFLFLREYGCDKTVSYIFMIIYETSIQINGLRKGHPQIIAGICLVPVVFYLLKKYVNTNKKKWLFLSAMIAGMQLTIHLQLVTYELFIIAIYLLAYLITNKETFGNIIKLAIFWFLFFVGAIAYFVLPYAGALKEYLRWGASSTSYETFCSYSMSPIKLLQMVIPEVYGQKYQAFGTSMSSENDLEIYLGLFVFFLAISFISNRKNVKKYIPELLCGGGALIIACTAHIPIFRKVMYHIPIVGGYRCSGRALPLFIFFTLTIAASALNAIEKEQDILKKVNILSKITFLIILSVGASFLFWVSCYAENPLSDVSMFVNRIGRQLVICLIIATITGLLEKHKKIVMASVLIITLIDVVPYSLETQPTMISGIDMPEQLVNVTGKDDGRIWDDYSNPDGGRIGPVSQNRNALNDRMSLNAFTAINNPLLAKYMKNLGAENTTIPFNFSGLFTGCKEAESLLKQNDLLSMLAVKYIVDSDGFLTNMDDSSLQDNYRLIYEADGYLVYENLNAKCFVYSPQTVEEVKRFSDFYNLDGKYDLAETAYIREEVSSNYAKANVIDVKKFTSNSIECNVDSTADTFICFSQAYSSKWKAKIDGKSVPISMVNGLIMGISVPEGNHTITFEYVDVNYYVGLVVTLGFICVLITLFVKDKRKEIV